MGSTERFYRSGFKSRLAFEAIDTMANEYDVSPLEMKVEAVEKAAKKARTAEQKRAVAEVALKVADEAICNDGFDVAKQMVRQASRLFRSAGDRGEEQGGGSSGKGVCRCTTDTGHFADQLCQFVRESLYDFNGDCISPIACQRA